MPLRATAIAACGLAAATLALGLRYGLIEHAGLELLCAQSTDFRCTLRRFVIAGFSGGRLGWFSLAAAVLALLPRLRPLAWAGWVSGCAGLVLYCFDTAAPAALLALLVLARTAAASSRQSTSQA